MDTDEIRVIPLAGMDDALKVLEDVVIPGDASLGRGEHDNKWGTFNRPIDGGWFTKKLSQIILVAVSMLSFVFFNSGFKI